jgi:hypothetical protein
VAQRYALVLTDTHMTPGVHGLLNGLLYYGMEEVEVHYLYWPGSTAHQALEAGTYDFYPYFVATPLAPTLLSEEYAPLWADTANCCYHSRWAYAGLLPHEVVCVSDADLTACNSWLPYFEVAAATGLFCTPNNDYSGYEPEAADLSGIVGDASPPLHNNPCFFSPAVWGDLVREIPRLGLREQRSDIVALSRLLLERGLMDRVLTLPNCLWLATHYYNQRLWRREVGGKRYLGLHESGDRLYAFHRRWWMPYICTQFATDATPGPDRDRALNNIRLFHEHSRFLNQDCTHRLEGYDFTWEEPQ